MTRPTLTIVHSSDTHNAPFARNIPRDGDVFILSGDGTMGGTRGEVQCLAVQLEEAAKRFKHVIFMPGNHDFMFEQFPDAGPELFDKYTPENVHLLIYQELVIEGYRFFAQPSVPELVTWAFGKPRMGEELDRIWTVAPKDIDVLIAHGPPHGIHDRTCYIDRRTGLPEHVGCELFKMHLPEFTNLKLAVFGHIHEDYGATRIGETIFSNGCFLNRQYDKDDPNPMHSYELNDTRAEFLID